LWSATAIFGFAFLAGSLSNAADVQQQEARQMKRFSLIMVTLAAMVVLGTGCASTKKETKSMSPPAVSSAPSTPAPEAPSSQPEIVTPPVTLPPAESK
jgi:hypothetical protein